MSCNRWYKIVNIILIIRLGLFIYSYNGRLDSWSSLSHCQSGRLSPGDSRRCVGPGTDRTVGKQVYIKHVVWKINFVCFETIRQVISIWIWFRKPFWKIFKGCWDIGRHISQKSEPPIFSSFWSIFKLCLISYVKSSVSYWSWMNLVFYRAKKYLSHAKNRLRIG